METFSYIYKVFYDRNLFRKYIQNGKGFGLKVLLVLAIFVSFFLSAKLFFVFSRVTPEIIRSVSTHMPDIEVKDGRISAPEDYFYSYVSPDAKTFFVFNTSDTPVNLSDYPSRGFYLTASALTVFGGTDTRLIPLDRIFEKQNFSLTRNNLAEEMNSVFSSLRRPSSLFMLFTLMVPGIYVLLLGVGTVYVLISYAMTALLKIDLTFEERLRLTALSIMPVYIFNTMSSVADLNVRLHTAGIAVSLIYMYCFLKDKNQNSSSTNK